MLREKMRDGSTVLRGGELTMDSIMLALNPVGKIYMSVDDTDPSELFGGEWEFWGAGRVPVGVDASQAEFNTVEETGGEKTHLLTEAELPSHDHQVLATYNETSVEAGATSDPRLTSWNFGHGSANDVTGSTEDAGSSDPHNNLQPYITCYMWKRVG